MMYSSSLNMNESYIASVNLYCRLRRISIPSTTVQNSLQILCKRYRLHKTYFRITWQSENIFYRLCSVSRYLPHIFNNGFDFQVCSIVSKISSFKTFIFFKIPHLTPDFTQFWSENPGCLSYIKVSYRRIYVQVSIDFQSVDTNNYL